MDGTLRHAWIFGAPSSFDRTRTVVSNDLKIVKLDLVWQAWLDERIYIHSNELFPDWQTTDSLMSGLLNVNIIMTVISKT